MKKILSLFIVIAILSMTLLTASAASIMNGGTVIVADAPAGIIADVVELENTVEVTVKIKGEMNISSFAFVLQYNSAKVSIANATTKASYTGVKLSTGANVAPYIENLAGTGIMTGWNMSTNVVDPVLATKYFAVGYGNVTGANISLASGATASLCKIYFNKLADVVSTDFNYIKVVTTQSKLINGTMNVFQGTGTDTATNFYRGDRFTTAFTNYEEPVTGYVVSYNTNGGNAIADEAEATTLPATLPTPTKDGYVFDGWFTDAGLTAAATPSAAIAAATTLYAAWTVAPIVTIDPIAPPVTVAINVKNKNGDTVEVTAPVVTITGKVPASVNAGNIASHEFGVIFGGVKFRSMSTWNGLNGNAGKYIIKLVDPTGKIPAGTYKAQNYLDAEISGDTSVVIGN